MEGEEKREQRDVTKRAKAFRRLFLRPPLNIRDARYGATDTHFTCFYQGDDARVTFVMISFRDGRRVRNNFPAGVDAIKV